MRSSQNQMHPLTTAFRNANFIASPTGHILVEPITQILLHQRTPIFTNKVLEFLDALHETKHDTYEKIALALINNYSANRNRIICHCTNSNSLDIHIHCWHYYICCDCFIEYLCFTRNIYLNKTPLGTINHIRSNNQCLILSSFPHFDDSDESNQDSINITGPHEDTTENFDEISIDELTNGIKNTAAEPKNTSTIDISIEHYSFINKYNEKCLAEIAARNYQIEQTIPPRDPIITHPDHCYYSNTSINLHRAATPQHQCPDCAATLATARHQRLYIAFLIHQMVHCRDLVPYIYAHLYLVNLYK